MTDTTSDIAAIRAVLPRIVSNAAHGPLLYFDAATWDKACHPDRIARLLDALEAAQKDAERYRWLRAQERNGQLDAVVDAAMENAP